MGVTGGEVLTVFRHGREVSGQFLADRECLSVLVLRPGPRAPLPEEPAEVEVPRGQILTVFGLGELGRQFLVERERAAVRAFRGRPLV